MENKQTLIRINLQYRDACNYKNSGEDFFTNNTNIPLEDIIEVFEPYLENDGIMVQDFGITSIAPIDNEFLPASGDDHSYCEIISIEEFQPTGKYTDLTDISEVIELVKNPTDKFMNERKAEASKILKEHLNLL